MKEFKRVVYVKYNCDVGAKDNYQSWRAIFPNTLDLVEKSELRAERARSAGLLERIKFHCREGVEITPGALKNAIMKAITDYEESNESRR